MKENCFEMTKGHLSVLCLCMMDELVYLCVPAEPILLANPLLLPEKGKRVKRERERQRESERRRVMETERRRGRRGKRSKKGCRKGGNAHTHTHIYAHTHTHTVGSILFSYILLLEQSMNAR